MPELPEVETIKNELFPLVVGRTITDVAVFSEKTVRQPSLGEFQSGVREQKITGLSRRGKYLIFSLASGKFLILHFKMTGSLLFHPLPADPEKFIRAVFHLDNGQNLYFRDPRKFGVMRLVDDPGFVVGHLGPEPLQPSFTPKLLAELLAKRKAPIKAVLIDQDVIAGIGNMYADEAIFTARIHPLRPANSLSQEEVERLHHAIVEVLTAAISNKGASIENYYRPGGTLGIAHFQFRVAHRGGEPCPNCESPIMRITVRGRGTYFCPCSQKLEQA